MNYSGMTVNERLVISGLLKEFDKARKKKDSKELISLLKKIEIDESSINKILEKFGIQKNE
jgi:hypothetical protein